MVLAEIRSKIAQVTDEPGRKAVQAAWNQVRARLAHLDLRDCGWSPQAGATGQEADLLHADTQKMVSVVLRVDHKLRRVTVLKYVVKVKR